MAKRLSRLPRQQASNGPIEKQGTLFHRKVLKTINFQLRPTENVVLNVLATDYERCRAAASGPGDIGDKVTDVMSVEHWIDLRCHPWTLSETVQAIGVLVRRSANAELQMTLRLDGGIRRIRVPSPSVPRIAAELWRHTCFEALIAVEGNPLTTSST